MSDSRIDAEQADLLVPAAVADPYPALAQLREHEPVHWSEKYRSWFITRFDDVSEALKDPRFSSDRITPYQEAKLGGPHVDPLLRGAFGVLEDWMVFKDPPDHTRLRRLLSRAFTPRSVSRVRPRITVLANELLDAAIAKGTGRADLIRDFSYPLTASVIAEMLGVPRADQDRFKDWSDQISGLVFGSLNDEDRHARGANGMAELTAYLSDLVREHERQPADDLLSTLIAARDDNDHLSADEVISTGVLLLFAGHETTTNLIGSSVLAFLRNPEQRELLDRDPNLLDGAVEEMLRYDGPAKSVVRLMSEDVEWRGRTLRRGERVFLFLAGANRDSSAFEDPDKLDITRRPGRQLGFSAGMHYCLGAPLARLETSITVPLVLRRLPRLAPVPDDPIHWMPTLLTRGMERFPVRFDVP